MPENQDKKIQHTHDNDLTHSMVHYLLAIHKLKEKNGYARVTDIARELNLTKGSVSTAINNLKRKELVKEDDSKFLSLSHTGHDEVHRILTSRTLLYYFFKDFVQVSEENAHKDSCLMEHLLSDESREGLFQFMKKIQTNQIDQLKRLDLSLDLAKFDHAQDFVEAQKGDSYLTDEDIH
jgi:DtxR family Mn-dependent transcriptional regulator